MGLSGLLFTCATMFMGTIVAGFAPFWFTAAANRSEVAGSAGREVGGEAGRKNVDEK